MKPEQQQQPLWKLQVLQGLVAQQRPVQDDYRPACQRMQHPVFPFAALLGQLRHHFQQPLLQRGFRTSTAAQTRDSEQTLALSPTNKNARRTLRNYFSPAYTTLSTSPISVSTATTFAPAGCISMRMSFLKCSAVLLRSNAVAERVKDKLLSFLVGKKLSTAVAAGLPSKSAARSGVQSQIEIKMGELEFTTAADVWHHFAMHRLVSTYSNPVRMSKRLQEQGVAIAAMHTAVSNSTHQPGYTVINLPGHTGVQESIFSFAWEGIQGTRPLSEAFLEKCSRGLEEKVTEHQQQLHALMRADKHCDTCTAKLAENHATSSEELSSSERRDLEEIEPPEIRTTLKNLFQDLACSCYIAEALHLSSPSLLRVLREAAAMAAALSLHSAYQRWSERQRPLRQCEALTEGFVLGKKVSFKSTQYSARGEEVTAENAALLLRSLGSRGTTGTHTVPYISDLLSSSFRQESRRQETTPRCDYGYSSTSVGTHTSTVNEDETKFKVEPLPITSSATPPCNDTFFISMEKLAGTADETTCPRISSSSDGGRASIVSTRQGIHKRWRGRKQRRLVSCEREKKYGSPPHFDLRHPGDTIAALVQALMFWTRASKTTASSLTNAIQGYALNARKQGLIQVHWPVVETFLKPIANNAALFSSQQSMEIFEALLLLDCRDKCPNARTVVETLSSSVVRRIAGTNSPSTTILPYPISHQQLVLWLVVLAKYRVENDEVYMLACDNLQHLDTLQNIFTPSLIAGCTYALTKFLQAGPLSLMIENMVVLARKQLHRFNLGDMSQLLVSLSRRDAADKVLLARCAARLKKDLTFAFDVVDFQNYVDLAVSGQQVVNLCVAFARQRFQDEILFDRLAHLLIAPYLRYSAQCSSNGTVARNSSQSSRLDHLGFGDLTSIVVAFARVRILHSALFQEVDMRLLDRLQTASSSALTICSCIQLLKAHSKLAYHTIKLQQCILLTVTRYLCGTNTQRETAKELADFLKAADDLGLLLTPALRKRLKTSLPRHILFSNASEKQSDKDDLTMEPPIGEWRGRFIECSGLHRKRKKARKRKWTW